VRSGWCCKDVGQSKWKKGRKRFWGLLCTKECEEWRFGLTWEFDWGKEPVEGEIWGGKGKKLPLRGGEAGGTSGRRKPKNKESLAGEIFRGRGGPKEPWGMERWAREERKLVLLMVKAGNGKIERRKKKRKKLRRGAKRFSLGEKKSRKNCN